MHKQPKYLTKNFLNKMTFCKFKNQSKSTFYLQTNFTNTFNYK